MIRSRHLFRALVSAGAMAWSLPAIAQVAAPTVASQQAPESTILNCFTGLFAPSRTNLLGSMGGLRDVLGNYGTTLNITDAETLLGNVSGGIKQGATM